MEKFKSPKICLLSMSESVSEKVSEQFEIMYKGSIGKTVKANYTYGKDCKFLLNYGFPLNLHEYDLFFLDMISNEMKEYVFEEHKRTFNKTDTNIYFYTNIPQTVFDPRNYNIKVFFEMLHKKKQKNVVVLFAVEEDKIKYQLKNFSNYKDEEAVLSTYSFLGSVVNISNKFGTEFITIESPLKSFFDKYAPKIKYHAIFKPDDYHLDFFNISLIPLLYNKDNELIAFILEGDITQFIILPDMEDKESVVMLLLNDILPNRYPELFPYTDKNDWPNQSPYFLPDHQKLLDEQQSLVKKFEEDIRLIEHKIEKNKIKFKFLHDMIQTTGDPLVMAMIQYFKWLGIQEVVDKDKTATKLFEEDLQIFHEGKMLIIEVKGIASTSKDEDCSQIAKVRTRRMKELKRTDIDALYLVNHQRLIPPLARINPPFQPQQIEDAVDDHRGLLTTWQLFIAYKLVQQNILTRNDIIRNLFDVGLVKFQPKHNFTNMGMPLEIHANGKVVIIKLDALPLKVGDQLLVESDGHFHFIKILSLQLNNVDVQFAINGEVGFKIDGKVRKTDYLYKRKNTKGQ
jgi:hypothetical protein